MQLLPDGYANMAHHADSSNMMCQANEFFAGKSIPSSSEVWDRLSRFPSFLAIDKKDTIRA